MNLVHVVARTRGGFDQVTQWASGRWLWSHLREHFPDALAACLMPNHLHLLVPWLHHMRDVLRRVLQHHTRQFGARWDLGPETPVHTQAIARRVFRYDALNPYWPNLVDDPLKWPWSTLRDAVGAIADPWITRAMLRERLGWTPAQAHEFVVSDPDCTPATRRPVASIPAAGSVLVGLDAIVNACAASLRAHPDDLGVRGHPMRPTVIALARGFGSPSIAEFASLCRVSERGVSRLQRRVDPAAVRAATACLADPRLRIWACPPTANVGNRDAGPPWTWPTGAERLESRR